MPLHIYKTRVTWVTTAKAAAPTMPARVIMFGNMRPGHLRPGGRWGGIKMTPPSNSKTDRDRLQKRSIALKECIRRYLVIFGAGQ